MSGIGVWYVSTKLNRVLEVLYKLNGARVHHQASYLYSPSEDIYIDDLLKQVYHISFIRLNYIRLHTVYNVCS